MQLVCKNLLTVFLDFQKVSENNTDLRVQLQEMAELRRQDQEYIFSLQEQIKYQQLQIEQLQQSLPLQQTQPTLQTPQQTGKQTYTQTKSHITKNLFPQQMPSTSKYTSTPSPKGKRHEIDLHKLSSELEYLVLAIYFNMQSYFE